MTSPPLGRASGSGSTHAPTVYILRGWPGSGKTARVIEWLRRGHELVRVSRDDLRMSLFHDRGGLTIEQEGMVTDLCKTVAVEAMTHGYDVAIDATNLRLRDARGWATIAVAYGASFKVVDMATPVEECIARDSLRTAQSCVGEASIRWLARKYPKPWPDIKPALQSQKGGLSLIPMYLFVVAMPLALPPDSAEGLRLELASLETRPQDATMVELLQSLKSEGFSIGVVCVNRGKDYFGSLLSWLEGIDIPEPSGVWMRAEGDESSTGAVELDCFVSQIGAHFDVHGVIQHSGAETTEWGNLGIACITVQAGCESPDAAL